MIVQPAGPIARQPVLIALFAPGARQALFPGHGGAAGQKRHARGGDSGGDHELHGPLPNSLAAAVDDMTTRPASHAISPYGR
ncbi:hypothetical protein D3C85_1397610 [compost metagenome]